MTLFDVHFYHSFLQLTFFDVELLLQKYINRVDCGRHLCFSSITYLASNLEILWMSLQMIKGCHVHPAVHGLLVLVGSYVIKGA